MAITVLTSAATPNRTTQTQSAFNAAWTAFFLWLATFVSEVNATATQVSTDAANATAAASGAANTIWVSGTTYAVGDRRWDPTTYADFRRKTAGSGTTRPALDTTNWASIYSLDNLSLTNTTTVATLVGTSTTEATTSTAAGTKLAGGLAVAKTLMVGVGISFPDADTVGTANIVKNAVSGLRLRGITGSSYDYRLQNGAAAEVMNVPTGTVNVNLLGTLNVTSTITANALLVTKGYTVATLPAGVIGARAYVTDALTPTYGATVAAGGAVVTGVFYNGSAWKCM